MNKEDLMKEFLSDDIVEERGHMPKQATETLRWVDHIDSKLVEVIKIAIMSRSEGDSTSITVRKLNQFLNK